MNENELSYEVIGGALEVHKVLGPGLLESAYETALKKELELRGLLASRQVGLPVEYKGENCEIGYRIDLLVENKLVVEVKSVEALNDIHLAQVLTYLKLGHHKLGLLINFNVAKLKNGIQRVVNKL
ncbi:MAG: GxxExxY protein [Bacteroidota bacterium]